MKCRDIMSRRLETLSESDTIARAAALMAEPSAQMIMTAPALTCLADSDLRTAEELMARERKARLVATNGTSPAPRRPSSRAATTEAARRDSRPGEADRR